MQLSIHELLNSNHLTQDLTEGALLQVNSNRFILFLGKKCEVFDLLQSYTCLQPQFWSFLEPHFSALFTYPNVTELNRDQLLQLIERKLQQDKRLSNEDSQLEYVLKHVHSYKKEFNEQFDWSMKHFEQKNENQLKKTVPITLFESELTKTFSWWKQLFWALQNQTFGYLYANWNNQEGIVGLTPEVLAEYSEETWKTMAVAGTWLTENRKNNLNEVDDKIHQEHQFVVDDILEKWPEGKAQNREIMTMPVISHLKTIILDQSEKFNSNTALDKVMRLHPTAALGVYPRTREYNQNFSQINLQAIRGSFGAPFGVIFNSEDGGSSAEKKIMEIDKSKEKDWAFVVVSIRQFRWNIKENKIHFFVGCGVTQQSEFETEWKELQSKLKTICRVFNFKIENLEI